MTTFAGGMTPTQFYNGLNSFGKIFNVKDTTYGAIGNGVTDDTVAIQAAINAAHTAGGGVVWIPYGTYIIGGALQTNIGGINYKSQLYIPQNSGDTSRVHIKIMGELGPNFIQSCGIGGQVAPIKGVILRSTLVSSTAYSYVIASIGDAGNFTSFNYNQCSIENLQIQVTANASSQITLGGIGFNDTSNTGVIRNVSIFPYNLNLVNSGSPINNCIGIAMPKINCEHINVVENCNVGGFETGFLLGDHTSLKDTVADCCIYGYNIGANYHAVFGTRIAAFWCINAIYFSGEAYIHINELQTEWSDLDKWYDSAYTVLDVSNYGHGELHYNIVEAGVGFNNAKFSKSGGVNLQCMPIAFAAAASFTVTGKRNDATALTNLLTALAAKGIIIDSTTAS
jgi:hypothetical protein